MLAALRHRFRSLHFSPPPPYLTHGSWANLCFSSSSNNKNRLLDLNEVEKVLTDVRAEDVKIIPVGNHCDWADYMVIATGRSTWHVKNIAQALIYKAPAKQKQKGAERMMLPSVEGQEGGKWIVIDSGLFVLHSIFFYQNYDKSICLQLIHFEEMFELDLYVVLIVTFGVCLV